MPVEVEVHTVPHFKVPINGKIDLWGPECGGTFILDYNRHLLHTLARINIGPNHVLCTKIRFPQSPWSLHKDCHPLVHLRYKYHWWDLSNEVLHEVLSQSVSELSQVWWLECCIRWNQNPNHDLAWRFSEVIYF